MRLLISAARIVAEVPGHGFVGVEPDLRQSHGQGVPLGEAQQATPQAHVLRAGRDGDVLEQEMTLSRLHHEQAHELIAVLSDPRTTSREPGLA
jgi:hypothetical protein